MSDEARLKAEIGFAQHLIAAGRLADAQKSLAAIQSVVPVSSKARSDLAAAWRRLGRGYFDSERLALAVPAFEQAVTLTPTDSAALLDLGFAQCSLGWFAQAQGTLARIPDDAAEKAAAYRALAVMAIRMDELDKADNFLEEALRRDPGDAEAWSLRIQILYSRHKVGTRFREWTRLNAKNPAGRPDLLGLDETSWRFLNIALETVRRIDPRIRVDEFGFRLLTAAGKPEAAEDFLAADPKPDTRTLRFMADVCWLLRKPDDACRHYRASMDLRCQGEAVLHPLAEGTSLPGRLREKLNCRPANPPTGLPLVYVHWDAPDYLRLSLAQSLATNPASEIVVLGDATNRFEGVTHLMMTEVDAGARQFSKQYRHKGENDYAYELFCFERWFLLRDWMRKANVPRAVSLDSDILLFADLRNQAARFADHPAIFAGPGFAVVTRSGIEAYCDWLMAMFDGDALADMELVSDLSLLNLYLGQGGGVSLVDLGDAPFFDSHIRQSEGFAMQGGIKKIDFDADGHPYGARLKDGALVPFALLHFQGRTKYLMSMAVEGQALRETESKT
jgi:tetratricopeptide (TPR) repeat protein